MDGLTIIPFTISIHPSLSHHALGSVVVYVSPQLTLAKMSEKQMSLESFLEKGKDPMIRQQKTLRCQQKKVAFKRKYLESYLNYGFTATDDSHSPSLL